MVADIKKKIGFFIIALGCLVLSVVVYISSSRLYATFSMQEVDRPLYPKRKCLKPSETDLIGTWYAGGPSRNDTLIIRDDGFYKQIIHIDSDVNYESEWQPWWLEITNNGNFIHLKGMNLCAAFFNLEDCESTGGRDFFWESLCGENPTGEGIPANSVGILYAMDFPATTQLQHGMQLRMMYSQEIPWTYQLMP